MFIGKTKARTRCTGSLVEALRSRGLHVRWLNCSFLKRYFSKFGMRLTVRMFRRFYNPDLCFVFFHDLPTELMEEISKEIPTVVWMEEPRVNLDSSQLAYVQHVRLLCLSSPLLVRDYQRQGLTNASFIMSGFSPTFHKPAVTFPRTAAVFERDIAFIGSPGVLGNRPGFLGWLANHHRVEVFGPERTWAATLQKYPQLHYCHEVDPSGYAQICATSRIVLGLNQDHDSPLYFSNRVFLTLACRGFHLLHYVPGMEDVFENGKHLAWFKNQEECLVAIDHYLAHEDERLSIAENGYRLVMAKHKYEDRVDDILATLAGDLPLRRLPDSVLDVRDQYHDLMAKDAIIDPVPAELVKGS